MKKYNYNLFGLHFSSEIAFPGMKENEERPADVIICFGEVPDKMENPMLKGINFFVKPGQMIFKAPGSASFLVDGPERIVVDSLPSVRDEDLAVYLTGSVMAGLLQMRGYPVLHGTTVACNDYSLVFSGLSGAGKSTLAAIFVENGFRIVSDDLSPLVFDEGNIRVLAGYPWIKLWQDSLDFVFSSPQLTAPVREVLQKHYTFLPAIHEPSSPVKAVFFMETKNSGDLSIENVSGAGKFFVFYQNLYRKKYYKALGLEEEIFGKISGFLSSLTVKKLIRPGGKKLTQELYQLIINEVGSK